MTGLGFEPLSRGPISESWARSVGDITIQEFNFPTLEQAIQFTVETMVDMALLGRSDPFIRRIAGIIARQCKPRDGVCQAATLLEWQRGYTHFVADPGHELVQDPLVTLDLGIGDCDDLSVLFATIAEAMGMQTAFITGGMTGGLPRHVLPAVRGIGGGWVPAEVCHLSLAFGLWPPDFTIHTIYPIPR